MGYVLYTDKVMAKQPPNIGKDAVYGLASSLMNPKYYGGGKDLKNTVLAVHALLRQPALIIIVSDFIDMQPGWERYIKMLSEQYDLFAITVGVIVQGEVASSISVFRNNPRLTRSIDDLEGTDANPSPGIGRHHVNDVDVS